MDTNTTKDNTKNESAQQAVTERSCGDPGQRPMESSCGGRQGSAADIAFEAIDKSLIKVEGVRETPEAGEHWDGWCQAGTSWGGEWGSGVVNGGLGCYLGPG